MMELIVLARSHTRVHGVRARGCCRSAPAAARSCPGSGAPAMKCATGGSSGATRSRRRSLLRRSTGSEEASCASPDVSRGGLATPHLRQRAAQPPSAYSPTIQVVWPRLSGGTGAKDILGPASFASCVPPHELHVVIPPPPGAGALCSGDLVMPDNVITVYRNTVPSAQVRDEPRRGTVHRGG